jgi:oligo-1,6-glucosidase
VQLRKDNPVLVYGRYNLLDRYNPSVYAYTRSLDGKELLILLNFSSAEATAQTGLSMRKAKQLLCNYPGEMDRSTRSGAVKLRPYEALVYQLH